ncbi:MAG: DUF362 domain-containing protein [Dehalococcoidia bacterium]|nr:DUF362 domain-containing protein [Dehalococcoidia bacterium]
MIFEASDFVFTPPARLSWVRRVLIKPCAHFSSPYPVTTSPEILNTVIEGIRKVSDADIFIADGMPEGESIYPAYQDLKYNFHNVLMLDVRDSIFLEMENPLSEFFAVPTFWASNLVLRSDFLISVAPFKICGNSGYFSVANLLSLLPVSKYRRGEHGNWSALRELGIEKVLADLYFTMPSDIGIIEARQKISYTDNPMEGKVEECGKILVGDPYEVDREASQLAGVRCAYLDLIKEGRSQSGN